MLTAVLLSIALQGHRPVHQAYRHPAAPPSTGLPTVVLNTNDSGAGSLRQAIVNANSNKSGSVISFAIPGTGVHIISPTTQLPALTQNSASIDGTTEPGYSGTPLIEIDNTVDNSDVLQLSGTETSAYGLSIISQGTIGSLNLIDLTDSGAVGGCYIGVAADGSTAQTGHQVTGIRVTGGAATIGGPNQGDGNVIGACFFGIYDGHPSASGNTIQGNTIGLNAAGTATLQNTIGVYIVATQDDIRSNVLSGNKSDLVVYGNNEIIQNNLVGTNLDGSRSVGPQNSVGIQDAGAGSLISSNRVVNCTQGISTKGGTIQDNIIGLVKDGTAAGNSTGILIAGSSPTPALVIGTSPGSQIISGNNIGISIANPNVFVENNYIGLGPGFPEGNSTAIDLESSQCTITKNIISGSSAYGILVNGQSNLISWNVVGVGTGGSAREAGNLVGIDVVGTKNQLVHNSYYQNGQAIKLQGAGNNGQTAPVISFSPSGPTVTGSAIGPANSTLTLELDKVHIASAVGSGMTYLGRQTVNTDASGNATFSFTGFSGTSADEYGVLATDAHGNTSQFSTVASASISPSSTTVEGGKNVAATLTVSARPIEPQSFTISSDDSSASVAGSPIAFSSGQLTGAFTVNTQKVGTATTANLFCGNATSSITVQPQHLVQLLCVQSSIQGGYNATGRWVLDADPGHTLTLNLQSNKTGVATVNSTATGSAQVNTFPITTMPVSTDTSVTLTGVLNGVTMSAPMTVTEAVPLWVALSSSTITPGRSTTGVVQLTGAPGSNGDVVTLTSSNPAVSVPGTVKVTDAGGRGTFNVSCSSSASGPYTITATIGSVQKTATLTVANPTLASVAIVNPPIIGGNTGTGIVKLSGPAGQNGLTISLQILNSGAIVPPSVKVAAGQQFAYFPVQTPGVDNNSSGVFTASDGSNTFTCIAILLPARLQNAALAASTVTQGQKTLLTVVLFGKAGPSGASVSLQSDNSAVASVPGSAPIPAQGYYAYVPVTAGTTGTAHITVSYGGQSKVVTLNVN